MKRILIRALSLSLALLMLAGSFSAFALSNVRRGQIVEFGTFEQDGNYYNGYEPIQWQVLDVQGSYALLITRFVLDWQYFNAGNSQAYWSNSDVCYWLNNDFLYSAFDSSEYSQISNGVGPVAEKVFLLNEQEVRKYFSSFNSRVSYPTTACLNNGAYTWASTGGCYWWLRDTMTRGNYVYVKGITGSGDYDLNGQTEHQNRRGVRPAIWVQLGY